ncbi:MAG TPA: hypothetical protein VMI33_25530 [Streptosporangiaceae bacterium]|nr:hypothetical protein [Streptosporangiaceae bacterium]
MNGLRSTPAQRWLARLSFALAGLAIVILLVLAGLKSLAMMVVGLAAAAVSLAAEYFFLSRRGIWRWLSLAVFVLAPIAVIVAYAFRDLLWVAVLSASVWLVASMTARLALAGNQPDWRMPERPAQPPARHPYLIMNPKSGGGAYAEAVETPAYRGDKLTTTLNTLPDLLQGHRGARLRAQADGTEIEAPQALLVSNNPYGTGDIAGLGRRARLGRGIRGVVGVMVASARQAAGLLRGRHANGLSVLTTRQVEISADVPQIPVGVDGESILMPTPVTCTVSPGALRVRVPRERPGVPAPKPPKDWARLRFLAGISGTAPRSPH